MNNLIILDNSPNCDYLNKDNGILIKAWFSDKNDKELFRIKPILNKIKEWKKIKYDIFDDLIGNYFRKMNSKIKEEKIYNIITVKLLKVVKLKILKIKLMKKIQVVINIKNIKTKKIEKKNKMDVNCLKLENYENEKENNFKEDMKKKEKYFESKNKTLNIFGNGEIKIISL